MPVIASPYELYQHSLPFTELAEEALTLIGALGAGEPISAEDLETCRRSLNRLLDAWNNERLLVHTVNREAWTIAAGTQDLEIGPSGSLDTVRPQIIEQDFAFIKDGDSEWRMEIFDADEWGAIRNKNVTGWPEVLYYEPSFPRGVIHLWPKTDKNYELVLYNWQLLAQVSQPTQRLALPPGYADALVNQLALRIVPKFNRSASAELVAMAIESKARVKSMNFRPIDVKADSALLSPGVYDINTGDFRYHY